MWYTLSKDEKQRLVKMYENVVASQQEFVVPDIQTEANKFHDYFKTIPIGSKVLCIGVGPGEELKIAKEYDIECIGITGSADDIERSIRLGNASPGQVLQGLTEILPFASETFDYIIACQILEHQHAPMIFLLEQRRVLKTGGTIILEWPPCCDHATTGANPQHVVCYTPGQGEGLLLKSGFSGVRLTYFCDKSPIPKERYWTGEQEKGYVVAYATKIKAEAPYILNSETL